MASIAIQGKRRAAGRLHLGCPFEVKSARQMWRDKNKRQREFYEAVAAGRIAPGRNRGSWFTVDMAKNAVVHNAPY